MFCLDTWTFQRMVIVAGLLSNPLLETSTLSICIRTCSILCTISWGISVAVSTRVSNELGAGRPRAAKRAVAVGVGMSFTGEQEVVDSVAECILFIAALMLVESVSGVLCSVARGCGWQAAGAAGNLAAYYLVEWPAAVVLGIVYDLKVKGLCMGLLLGIFVQVTIYGMLTIITDWEKQAELALGRVCSATLPVNSHQSPKDGYESKS